jgi:hypothetical protein
LTNILFICCPIEIGGEAVDTGGAAVPTPAHCWNLEMSHYNFHKPSTDIYHFAMWLI